MISLPADTFGAVNAGRVFPLPNGSETHLLITLNRHPV